MRKLFGTDGIRGKANHYPITAELALLLGKATAYTFGASGLGLGPCVAPAASVPCRRGRAPAGQLGGVFPCRRGHRSRGVGEGVGVGVEGQGQSSCLLHGLEQGGVGDAITHYHPVGQRLVIFISKYV